MASFAERSDRELLTLLHVSRGWNVSTAGNSMRASSLAQALRMAGTPGIAAAGRALSIVSVDGQYRIGVEQIKRLGHPVSRRTRAGSGDPRGF